MTAGVRTIPFDGPLANRLAQRPGKDVCLFWLGQAGFVIDGGGRRVVVDPYLSDTLAAKYRDTPYPHERMMPAPVAPAELGPVDLVLVTHHHTDHMDGGTLKALAVLQPHLRFVVPAASAELAAERIAVGPERLLPVDAGQTFEAAGVAIRVFRAAHETFDRDASGRHRFLGYGVTLGGVKIFHSGDTIPFEGQREEIADFAPDLALLPVNGRSERLAAAGFAGNLTLAEAIGLCEACKIRSMIAHHHGMFAFNTLAPQAIDGAAERAAIQLSRAREHTEFRLDAGVF